MKANSGTVLTTLRLSVATKKIDSIHVDKAYDKNAETSNNCSSREKEVNHEHLAVDQNDLFANDAVTMD